MINKKLRHEYKHLINKSEELILSNRLNKLFRHDKYSFENGHYKVTSLYFDNYKDKALREKLDGVSRREKFRLRFYNDNLNFIRLEKKSKIKGLSTKYQEIVTLDEAKKIINGDLDFLLLKEEPLFKDFYIKSKNQLLKPKSIVIYDRQAYTYIPGNVRITLDKNLRTIIGNLEKFLDPFAYTMDISNGLTVLEVKYDEFLPDIVKMAVNSNLRSQAFSKYGESRNYD